MFLGNIKNFDYDKKFLNEKLIIGLKFLINNNLETFSKGKYEILGDNIFAIIDEYDTKDKDLCFAENHKKYIDIQYLISGEEKIYFADINQDYEILEKYDEKLDRTFYTNIDFEQAIILKKGYYAIFFENDIHRPCCKIDKSNKVKKCVIKIKNE